MLRPLCYVALAATLTLANKYSGHARYRRQLDDDVHQQLDLNVSVPYIFSARLYPYGPTKGDLSISGDEEAYRLENPFHYLDGVYDTIFIRSDGSVGLSPVATEPSPLPASQPLLAVFWMETKGARVYYRETDDANIVNLAHNEVNIQYRYGSKFRVKSVVLVTWEGGSASEKPSSEGNVFQLALIIGDQMTFAHLIYSRLNSNDDAVAGFSSMNTSYSLPDSGTRDVTLLVEKSDIGIPGEWLFRVDQEQVFLCGAGFKGLECVESCAPSQWSNDCYHSCHCDGGDACDHETGRCPNGKCSPGWHGEPVCDRDIDECSTGTAVCPAAQPDCLNTPGSFLCLCFEYDEDTKMCKGSSPPAPSEQIPVEVIPLRPSLGRPSPPPPPRAPGLRNRFGAAETTTMRSSTITTTRRPTTTTAETSPATNAVTNFVIEDLRTAAPRVCQNCDNNAHCSSGRCQCNPGWTGDGVSCSDVDECLLAATCGAHSVCSNTEGSFDCECERGFTFVDGRCHDIDECANSPCSGSGVSCSNQPGSYKCFCKDGYEGNPNKGCTDIDECARPDACGPNSVCSNQPGGFECECSEGFERLSESAGCTDIDECQVDPCHAAAVCSNAVGTFDCTCIDGFVGDGVQCHETILFPIANDSIVVARERDAMAAISLPSPVMLFGKECDTAYVSSNGLVSFSSALPGLIDRPEKQHQIALFPLHAQMDYAREGLVAYTYVNESDASAYSLLTRSSISIQTQFGLPGFRTRQLHVFTFDRMRQAGSENLNSFQAVIAQSDTATVLSLIYQAVQAKGPIVGVSTGSSFYALPSDVIASQSNVGRPGKWMLRVDGVRIESCPAGRLPPPLCQQDCPLGRWGFGCVSACHCAGGLPCDFVSGICSTGKCDAGWTGTQCDQDVDECAEAIVVCHSNADCINTRGSFECHCRNGYDGDGKTCRTLDRCLARHGRPCSSKAVCNSTSSCVCVPGFRGDGFSCRPEASLPVIDISKNIIMPSLEHQGLPSLPVDADVSREVGDHPFVMTSWITEKTPPTPTRRIPLLVTASVPSGDTTRQVIRVEENVQQADTWSSLVFIVLPVTLCVIWLLLIVVVIVCRKRKRAQAAAKPFDDVWKAPGRRTTTTVAISAPIARNPNRMASGNIAYGPRIRPYEGY